LLATLHGDLGVTDAETAAINLLPTRMAEVYAVEWDDAVFATMDRQVEVAARLGLIPAKPDRPTWDRLS
jgi:NitT/TauT family transport system substrate-binding protein